MATIPDNSIIPNTGLRKVSSTRLEIYERDLDCYKASFRELQIKESAYANFFTEVIRTTRQKHLNLLQRGTESSFHQLTQTVLRGFGYLIWPRETLWLVPDIELDKDEGRLIYDRKDQKTGNQKFYPIFHKLWTCMRNLVFEPKAARASTDSLPAYTEAESSPATESTRTLLNTPSHSMTYCDSPTDSHNSRSFSDQAGIRPFCELVSRLETRQYFQNMATSKHKTINGKRVFLSVAETENGVSAAIEQLINTRIAADPEVFKQIWEQKLARAEGRDALFGKKGNISSPSIVNTGGHLNNSGANASNETFSRNETRNDHTNEELPKETIVAENADSSSDDMFKDRNKSIMAVTEPSLFARQFEYKDFGAVNMPEFMAICINSSRISDYGDPHIIGVTPAAWLQPGARVRLEDMKHFLWSIELRARIPENCEVFCYVLSYDWSDGMHVIQNDKPGYMLEDGIQCYEKRKLGWHNFMLDIEAAVLKGNQTWSMKCMVLYGEVVEEETSSTDNQKQAEPDTTMDSISQV